MTKHIKPKHIDILTNKCDVCGACVGVCPPNVMSMTVTDLKIDFDGCTYCSLCIDICPVKALKGQY